ncbi:hypothetical protein BN1221_03185 [Brenneria goodwinii]|uniref:Uncharacterized protein n=1 Tax=Brenneria goodwinii TaxID=1109412 RepID=A0A0G4JXQ4_9GAMM|nr:hypothetical protein BN1221_03185 [Brenneria goodwinii]
MGKKVTLIHNYLSDNSTMGIYCGHLAGIMQTRSVGVIIATDAGETRYWR